MTTPREGDRRIFRLTPILKSGGFLDDYMRHDGQKVTVARSYEMPMGERSPTAFYVYADDGWMGAVFAHELEEIAE